MYEVRQMKKMQRIQKFFSDEKGSISIVIDNSKEKIASIVNVATGEVKTLTLKELKNKVPSSPPFMQQY